MKKPQSKALILRRDLAFWETKLPHQFRTEELKMLGLSTKMRRNKAAASKAVDDAIAAGTSFILAYALSTMHKESMPNIFSPFFPGATPSSKEQGDQQFIDDIAAVTEDILIERKRSPFDKLRASFAKGRLYHRLFEIGQSIGLSNKDKPKDS